MDVRRTLRLRRTLVQRWSVKHTLLCTMTLALLALQGCTSWSKVGVFGIEKDVLLAGKEDAAGGLGKTGLPSAKIPDQSSIVDVAFFPLGTSELSEEKPLPWDSMDESVIPVEVRRRLLANGFRVGRIVGLDPTQLPIAETQDGEPKSVDGRFSSDFERQRRRLSCRDGQPYLLTPRRQMSGNISTLVKLPEGLVGKGLIDPQYNFAFRTFQLDDGRVAISVVPEIHHGATKHNYISNDSLAFRLDFSRDSWILQELAIEVPLDEGQAIAILPVDQPFGLAKQMLVGRNSNLAEDEHTAVIIHLSRRPVKPIGGTL